MEKSPLVSVIITTFKRAEFLEKAIESVLSQTYQNIEIIVVDDNDSNSCFRKETEAKMLKYESNDNVKYIKHLNNKNGAAARNTGLQAAKGKYVTYLDDDDIYLEEKVALQVKHLERNSDFKAIYCGWDRSGFIETPELNGDLTYEILSGELVIRTNVIMMDREVSISIGGWNEEFKRNQEAVYLLRYFQAGFKIASLPTCLVVYDSTDRSNESNPKRNEEDFVQFLSEHKQIIDNLSKVNKNLKKKIYSKRYLSILLRYLKYRDFKNAIRIYFTRVLTNPLRFNIDLILYTFKKLEG